MSYTLKNAMSQKSHLLRHVMGTCRALFASAFCEWS